MIPDDFGSANRQFFSATPATQLPNLCHNIASISPSFEMLGLFYTVIYLFLL